MLLSQTGAARRWLAGVGIAGLLGIAAGVSAPVNGVAPARPREAQKTANPQRPHIVVIVADDMGNADVGFNGGKEIKTPHLDRLAASGAVLKQFYVQPVCSPTRAALLTGRYPMRHGLQAGVVRPWARYGLPLEERTLPQALKESGYQTAIVGKWHLGHAQPEYLPTRRGFDHQYGHYNGAIDYFTHARDGGHDWHRDDRVSRDEGYATNLIAREAVRRIQERDKSRPLFLYVPFNAVHAPLQVPPRYKAPYASLREPRRTYAGMLAAMDEAVGQISSALDAQGMRKDTLLVFSSDNGGPGPGRVTDNGPLRAGKGTLYEGGVRVAAFATWEGRIKPGTAVNQPLHIADWYPTLLKLGGASLSQKLPLDGKDIWPTVTEGQSSPHDAILLNTTATGGAIRMGDWKLVIGGSSSDSQEDEEGNTTPTARRNRRGAGGQRAAIELFNLRDDVSERNNLADKHPDRVKMLRDRYEEYARQAVPPKNHPKGPGFRAPKVWGEKE